MFKIDCSQKCFSNSSAYQTLNIRKSIPKMRNLNKKIEFSYWEGVHTGESFQAPWKRVIWVNFHRVFIIKKNLSPRKDTKTYSYIWTPHHNISICCNLKNEKQICTINEHLTDKKKIISQIQFACKKVPKILFIEFLFAYLFIELMCLDAKFVRNVGCAEDFLLKAQ